MRGLKRGEFGKEVNTITSFFYTVGIVRVYLKDIHLKRKTKEIEPT